MPFNFGKDSNGNYGYYKDGADTVTPFKSQSDVDNAYNQGISDGRVGYYTKAQYDANYQKGLAEGSNTGVLTYDKSKRYSYYDSADNPKTSSKSFDVSDKSIVGFMATGQFYNEGYIKVSGAAFLLDIYTEHYNEKTIFVYYLYGKTSNTLTITFILNTITSGSSSADMTLTALTLK